MIGFQNSIGTSGVRRKAAVMNSGESCGTLTWLPVSNYSARCRYIILKKGLNIKIEEPTNGMKSPEHLAISPFGQVPCFQMENGDSMIESLAIMDYLIDRYSDVEPRFLPATPELRARARMICQVHDFHCGINQGAMYRAMNSPADREAGLEKIRKGLDVIELYCEASPFMVGDDLSIADVTVFASSAFYVFMLPRFFGWDFRDGRPKLAQWFEYMRRESPEAEEVFNTVFKALAAWEKNGRWEKLGIQRVPSFVEAENELV
uniref:Glutathione transferase n=2 Tax=Rhodosorus marinus TaxID=101924 RepID=A0A7S3AAF6_9RHOD|mmetsp:Transcript_9098/g.40000  ORF Transcript_9098/g.40000 Transcript_9098/m.40000 type:complete len:262 (+) Transcript_9098:967-1752(+)|eukprot:CAMPEP_0113954784 /NCGR_PEP_ID=MMETSP0011_2-20120614/833_1 /TAXON_ID=101924 /ORGANISM="Rhodosorus marinus" /LENGTH=261 /DNA_ID=CAMNT_0000964127 /DNA_START=896 /DNA_END=1681 /DNA_ORIENTATION=- /assembly_acc=CAM_ASM_000156